jgi:hypothetical protein
MTLETLGQLALGATMGFGTFVGYTRANMKTMKEILGRVETKIDKLDDRSNRHAIAIARLETVLRTPAPYSCRGCERTAPLDPPPAP